MEFTGKYELEKIYISYHLWSVECPSVMLNRTLFCSLLCDLVMEMGLVTKQFLLESYTPLFLSIFHWITAMNYMPANLNSQIPLDVTWFRTNWIALRSISSDVFSPIEWPPQTVTTTGPGLIFFTISEMRGQNSRSVVLPQVFSTGPKVHEHETKLFCQKQFAI